MICGYSSHGDSTGMVLSGFKQYDPAGRTKLQVNHSPIAVESGPEQSVSSWFYSLRSYLGDDMDTTWYKYDSKGRLIEYRWYSELNGKRKSIYTYDASGRCIKEQDYTDGKLNYTENFAYDKAGRLISSNVIRDQKKSSWQTFTYDSAGQELRRLNFRMEAGVQYVDTFITIYGNNSITKISGRVSNRERNTTGYTDYDSVAMFCSTQLYKGKPYLNDTTFYTRDSITHQKLRSTKKTEKWVSTVEYYYSKGVLDSTVAKMGDAMYKIVVYDRAGHPVRESDFRSGKLFSVTTWCYTPAGDVLEERLCNPAGKLVQRETYTYTYY